jgi:hypothetical protein
VSPVAVARVWPAAPSDPTPGSVSAKLVIDLAAAMRGSQRLFCVAAGHHQALAADPDIGPEHRAEGGRRPPELQRDAHLLRHVKPEPAIFLGMERPNSPISRISATTSSGTSSSESTRSSSGPQPLGDVAAQV